MAEDRLRHMEEKKGCENDTPLKCLGMLAVRLPLDMGSFRGGHPSFSPRWDWGG